MISVIHKYCKWSLIAILCSISFHTNAGHILGADIRYTYVGPNMYLIDVRWYRDCQGLAGSQQISICYRSATAGVSGTVNLTQLPGGIPPWTPYLPPFPYWPPMTTTCYGGSAPGIEVMSYQGLITLPSAQTDWIVSYSTFPQNIGINQNFMYVSATIDNINIPINSSGWTYLYPTFFYCVNQPAWDNFSHSDMDADSFSYHLIPIEDNSSLCPHSPFISPVPAFPALQSMSSTPVTIDSTNGSLTFSPSVVGTSMVAVRIDEHRNGMVISSSTVQHVLYIVTGCVISGVDENETSRVTLHPNPATDLLKLEWLGKSTPLVIEVIDISGKISDLTYFTNGEGTYELNIATLSPGIYTVRVISEYTTSIQKFIKL